MGGLVPMAVVSRHRSLKGSQHHGTEPENKAQLCSSISSRPQPMGPHKETSSCPPHSIQAFVKVSLHRVDDQ